MLPMPLTLLPNLRLVEPREYCGELKKIVEKYAVTLTRRMIKQKSWKKDAPQPLSVNEIKDSRIHVYQLTDTILYSAHEVRQKISDHQQAYLIYIDYSDIFDYYEWKGVARIPDNNPIRRWFHDAYVVAALARKENLYGDFYTDNETKATLPASPTFKDPRTYVLYKRKLIITRKVVDNDIVLLKLDLSESCDEIAMKFKEEERWLTTSKYGVQLLQSIISKRNTKDREEENKARKLTYSIVFVNK